MPTLSTFPIPLQPEGPPSGYGWEEECETSVSSSTSAFKTCVRQRDTFLSECTGRCIICGEGWGDEYCPIIVGSENYWKTLKDQHWIPSQAKTLAGHEPRNGLILCPNHKAYFSGYHCFIRFMPDARKFVLINYSNARELAQYHGKAVALDIMDRHAPFPSLFIIHEMRVRGFRPFQPLSPAIPDDIHWQDWIVSSGVFDDALGSFKRTGTPNNGRYPYNTAKSRA